MLRGEPKEEGGYRNCVREPIALVGMGRQENNMWLPLGIRARPGSSHGLGPMAQPTASKVLREDFDWIMSELNRREPRWEGENPAQASVFKTQRYLSKDSPTHCLYLRPLACHCWRGRVAKGLSSRRYHLFPTYVNLIILKPRLNPSRFSPFARLCS